MRCSHFKVYHAIYNTEIGNDTADCRVHRDLKNHNWLMKKINAQRKMTDKNHNLKINNRNIEANQENHHEIVQIAEESPDREMEASLPVSIPSEFYYSRKNRLVRDARNADKGNTDVKSSKIFKKKLTSVQYMEKSDSEDMPLIYYEVANDEHEIMVGPRSDDQFQSHVMSVQKSNGINNKVTESNSQGTFIRTVKVSERATNTPSMFMNEQSIKHNLPLSAVPEREKYRMYKTKQVDAQIVTDRSGLSIARGPITIRSHITDAETQTDSVIFILEEDKEMLDLLKTNNITVEQITERLSRVYCDAETSTDSEDGPVVKNEPQEPEESERVKQAMACSQFNKKILKSHSQALCAGAYHNFPIPERVDAITDNNCSKGENLQKIVERLRPSLGEIHNNFNGDENRSNIEQRAAEEEKSVIKRRRVSLPAMPHQNYSCNENQSIANQHAAAARKPQLRGQRKPQMPTQLTYQHEQYHHHTAVAEEANYVNPNVPDNRMHINQYQYQRPQQQMSYNAGPRMMHPFAIQYTREHITQYPGMRGEGWNYSQHYAERPTMMQQPLTGDVVPTHTMPNGQQAYRHRNAVHISSYTDPNWDKNMMQNNGM